MLWVALQFDTLPPGTLEHLAAWACQFTPRVSPEPPRALLAEVQGSLRYFGGLEGLLARMRSGLAGLGFEASLAVATTPRAALWRARDGNKALEQVRVEFACDEAGAQFLKGIGISTLRELMRLPRAGLAKRCGPELVADLDRALGAAPEPREFFSPPERFEAQLELPGPVTQIEGVLFAARRLLLQLEGLLAARQAGVRDFAVIFLHQGNSATTIEIHLASPARQAERLARLLRERIAGVSLSDAVEGVRLRAAEFMPLHARSPGMFGDVRTEGEAWAQLTERLQARLGSDAVHGLTTQPDHRPECAWRRVEAGEWDPREFVQPGPRPLWLLPAPRRLGRLEHELLAGPERIECGWWDGDDAKRDYFVARSAGGELAWVYREDGDWFLHGLFA